MIKSATEVTYCVVLSDDLYKVSHKCGKNPTVNLATKIVHIVHSYTIPKCDCGDWMYYFIMCLCTIRDLTIAVWDVENVKTIILSTSQRFIRCGSWRVRNLTWRDTMTFLISILHKVYHPIKAVALLAVIVMQVGIVKLMSDHINTRTNSIACHDHILIRFLLWGDCLIVSR